MRMGATLRCAVRWCRSMRCRTPRERSQSQRRNRMPSSQRVAQAAAPYNVAADVCRRDTVVVIRARLGSTTDAPQSRSSGHSFSCHRVTTRKNTEPRSSDNRAAPQKGRCATAGMSSEAPFSTRNRRAGRPDRGRFEAKFRASPPASPPPSFGLVRSALARSPNLARGRSTNDRTRNGPRPEPPAQARVPTTDLTGRSGLRSKEHRLFEHCRSLPASRCARDRRTQRAGDENRSSAPTTTAAPHAGAAMERVQRNCRRATPYYESPHYGSWTYKIISEIDFSFGRDGGHRRS